MSTRIVVVGFGPVAGRLVEELLPAVRAGDAHLTILGAEPLPAYNRVLLAEVAVGRAEAASLVGLDVAALRRAGVEVGLGTEVLAVDRAGRRVRLADGTARPYDVLVLATGARAFVPPLGGLERGLPDGVTTLRDLDDAARVRGALDGGAGVVVLGGGVLGVEAALAARDRGAAVTLVHTGPWPLTGSLDRGGGALLTAALRDRGIAVRRGAATAVGTDAAGRFTGLRLADGTTAAGDLLLVSCGVRARTELAAACGLRVDRGVLVDHELRAAPGVYAIGDCAEVRCGDVGCPACAESRGPAGLVGPGWRQAEWLAAHLLGEQPEPLGAETPAPVLLKARDLDVVAAGDVTPEPFDALGAGEEVAQWADPAHGAYVKMVTREGVLTGLVCVGLPRTAAELVLLLDRGAELPADRAALLRLDAEPLAAAPGPESTLCRCSGATVGAVEGAIDGGCASVAEVGRATRAGTGCGGCRERIAALLEARQGALAP